MSSYGEVVIGGRRFPITGLRLARGGIEVRWDVRGPEQPFGGDMTFFGEDGQGCWQGSTWELAGPVPAGDTLCFRYYVTVSEVLGQRAHRLNGQGENLADDCRRTRTAREAEWPAADIGGRLSRETLDRAIDAFFARPTYPEPSADYSGLFDAMRWPGCTAVLFAPDEPVKNAFRDELNMRRIPVHPGQAAYFGPVQGPVPLACALEPHAEGTWHWDGKGTWFR